MKEIKLQLHPISTTKLETTKLLEYLFQRDLGGLFDGSRFRLARLGRGAGVSALEAHLNPYFEQHATIEPGIVARWALADLLCDHVQAGGAVDLDKLRQRFPGAIDPLLVALGFSKPSAAPVYEAAAPTRVWGDAWFADPARLPRLAWLEQATKETAQAIEPMPVVEAVAQHFGRPDLFSTTALFATQHGLGSTYGLLDAMVNRLGLIPSLRSTITLKSHSSSGLVERLIHDQIPAAAKQTYPWEVIELPVTHGLPGDPDWRPIKEDGYTFTKNSEQLSMQLHHWGTRIGLAAPPPLPGDAAPWSKPWKDPPKIGLVLDDGADALCRLNESVERSPQAPRLVGVEQTTFGLRKLKALQDAGALQIPVVDVAGSALKRHLESVIIGWSATEQVRAILDELAADGLPRKNHAVLLGYGAVGRASARLLSATEKLNIVVIDDDPGRRAQAERDGFKVATAAERRAALQAADYVLGATGESSVKGADFRSLKPGAVLFSLSSSSIEFAAGPLDGVELGQSTRAPQLLIPRQKLAAGAWAPIVRADFEGKEVALGPAVDPIHWHRVLNVSGADRDFQVLLANSGYPITFRGQVDPIRPKLIQLTRAALELACIEAVGLPPEARGLIPLSAKGQRFIAESWLAEVRGMSELPPIVHQMLAEGLVDMERELAKA
ncbi:MAG: NAD-binding protein [Myxococcota bacterium]